MSNTFGGGTGADTGVGRYEDLAGTSLLGMDFGLCSGSELFLSEPELPSTTNR